MNYDLVGRVMTLVLEDTYYADRTIEGARNAILTALDHDRCLVHWLNGEVVGYCTWGFFTRE